MSRAEPFVVMAKPAGPVDCGYCYYLAKTGLFPAGEYFRMRSEVLEAYASSFIAASPGPLVHGLSRQSAHVSCHIEACRVDRLGR